MSSPPAADPAALGSISATRWRPWRNHPDRWAVGLLATLAYLPMLLTAPGQVSADTKSYLTIDPGHLLGRAWSMWDPAVGAGTVTHQNIGYLFPLGPLYWVFEQIGVPDWMAQRLIWATIVFAAATGVLRLTRWLGWAWGPAVVAAVAYGWSPYLLSYLARLSVILLPWAALGWLVLFAARAVREPGWRWPARFALVVAVVGTVNATSLVLVGLGPIVWILADASAGRVSLRALLGGAARIGALCLVVSIWWIVALRVQGAYGIPILRYTETYEAVAAASTPPEVLRGLGYWFFYGGDRLGPWIGPAERYVGPWMLGLGYALVGLALVGLTTITRGRRRAIALLVIGLAISVGAAPLDRPTPYGRAFRWFVDETTAGMALRSTPRAAPLVLLALAMGTGAAVGAAQSWLASTSGARSRFATRVRSRTRPLAPLLPALAIVLIGMQIHPWFTGDALTDSLLRDEALPDHRHDLAGWLDASGTARVYVLPGSDFAAYRWGGTVDPVLPGMIDRPVLARELVPQGGAGTADLLNAFERRMHDGWFEPDALLPLASRFGIGTIVVRNDLEHERYRLARPDSLWGRLRDALGEPDFAGPLTVDRPEIPMLDELALADRRRVEPFPIVAAWDLDPEAPLLELHHADPILLVGSGDGLIDLAAAGLDEPSRPVIYAATLARHPELDLGESPRLVLTDTNRRRGHRWSTLGSNRGALEQPGEAPLERDPGDNRLDVFTDDDLQRTVLELDGPVAAVRATGYGNRIAYTPEDAPIFAIDGDPRTAWRTGVFDDARGERIEIHLREPVRADSLVLVQPQTGVVTRYITDVRVHLDGNRHLDVVLDDRSRTPEGQPIDLDGMPVGVLGVEILADNLGPLTSYAGQPGVGFAEIRLGDTVTTPVAVLPSAWMFDLAERHDDAQDWPLDVIITRERIDPATPNRSDPEPHLERRFDLAWPVEVTLFGHARLSALADERLLAEILGERIVATANRRLPGSPAARGQSAVDGDPTTAWITPFDEAVGSQLNIELLAPDLAEDEDLMVTVEISWRSGASYSRPTELLIQPGGGQPVTATIPADAEDSATASLVVPKGTSTLVLEITAVDPTVTPEYFSGMPRVAPVGVTSLTVHTQSGENLIPEVGRSEQLPDTCREDLVFVDGRPISVRLLGARTTALDRDALELVSCSGRMHLDRGTHRISSPPGPDTGVDIDRLILRANPTPAAATPASPIAVTRAGPVRISATIEVGSQTRWLIWRESWNPGWQLSVNGVRQPPPVLIDGYANGWMLPGTGETVEIELRWTPQSAMPIAWAISALGLLLALILGLRRRAEVPIDATGAWRPRRGQQRVIATIGVLVLALVGGLFGLLGIALGVITRRHRLTPALVLAIWTVIALIITGWQFGYRAPPDPDWPSRFSAWAPMVWTAIAAAAVARPADEPITVMPGGAPPGH